MHIRRLRVLLTEMTIGSPILDVAFNEMTNDVEIDFEESMNKTGKTQAACRKENFHRVRREGGGDLKDAVGYCLKQGTTPDDVVREDIAAFYDNVVDP